MKPSNIGEGQLGSEDDISGGAGEEASDQCNFNINLIDLQQKQASLTQRDSKRIQDVIRTTNPNITDSV